MTSRTNFRLPGIEPDNLLGFLALLGVLQAIETDRPTWNPRIAWGDIPWRPTITISAVVDENKFIETIGSGLHALSAAHHYDGHKDLKLSQSVARAFQRQAAIGNDRIREQVVSALFSDGAIKPDSDEIVGPPLCTMLGQGHQHSLSRLISVSTGTLPKALRLKKSAPDLNSNEYLRRALFMPWTRSDETEAFRWDPLEDRRYALRDVDPSGDPARTEHGANRLAVAGFSALVSIPTGLRSSVAIATLGFLRGDDRRTRITWPIWESPIDLATILALLARRELHDEHPAIGTLANLGVIAAFRAYRLEVGYYANFSVAESLVTR